MPFSQQVAFTGGVEEGGKIGRLKKVVCNLSAYLHSLGKDIVMPSRLLHIVSGSVSGWMAGLCQSHNPKHLKQTAAYLTPRLFQNARGDLPAWNAAHTHPVLQQMVSGSQGVLSTQPPVLTVNQNEKPTHPAAAHSPPASSGIQQFAGQSRL